MSIKRFFYNRMDGITKAAFAISFFSLASKILGLVRDRILAGAFGAGDTLDMYYAAFRIPDTIFNLIVIGALSASFIPILSEYYYKEDRANFFRIANNVLNIFLAVMVGIGLAVFLFMPFIMKFVIPGWSGDKFDTTVSLTRVMLFGTFFLTLSSVSNGILQSTKRFLIYAAAPLGYNIGIIAGAIFLVKFFGIYGLALGVILGAGLQFLIAWPVVKSLGYKYQFLFDYKDKDIRRIFKLMIPRTLSLGVGQVNLFVITSVASTLSAGSLAIFNLAGNIQNIFFVLAGISFSVAVFPAMASYLSAGQKEKFTASFSQAFREIILFIIPASAFLIIFRAEIVSLIFKVGNFDIGAVAIMEKTLLFFAAGLAAQSLISLVVRVFWALGDTKTPFYTSLFGMAATIVIAVWAGREYGVAGLAIAYSATNIVNFILLFALLRKNPVDLDEKRIYGSFMKILLATAISSAAAWYFQESGIFFGFDKVSVFYRLISGSAVFIFLFISAGRLIGIKEFFIFTEAFKKRFLIKKNFYSEEIFDDK